MSLPTYMSGMLFTQAHKAVRSHIYDVLEVHQLNPTYWSLLSIVVRSDAGIRPARVAEMLDVKPPLVTMIAADLSKTDLLQQVPHHTDKRAKLLVATAKGRKLAQEIEAELTSKIYSLMQGLSDTEIKTFQKILETIIANSAAINKH